MALCRLGSLLHVQHLVEKRKVRTSAVFLTAHVGGPAAFRDALLSFGRAVTQVTGGQPCGLVDVPLGRVRSCGKSLRGAAVGEGGGTGGEDIIVHLVSREELPGFAAKKREEGVGLDAKLLMLMDL